MYLHYISKENFTMKRTLILCIVLLAFCISLVACGGLAQDDVDNAVKILTETIAALTGKEQFRPGLD